MREAVFDKAREYFRAEYVGKKIIPGESYIPPSGKVLEEDDLINLIDSSLDLWLTAGRFAKAFEKDFARFMEQKFCLLVNSGSSANLLAFAGLTSPELGDRQIKAGDEVITVAAGFPTTVNPIVQYGCIPVFVDIELGTYEIDIRQMEKALSPKTKAIMLAHTLGNAFDVIKVKEFCSKHGLWLIEDCCDAVGTRVNGKMVGTFGDVATVSFYPAHHMTMGEGGAVLCNDPKLKKYMNLSEIGEETAGALLELTIHVGKRFKWQLGELPEGFDHKYIYSHIGYNLKVTDMQAALGVSQLRKINGFIDKRRENFKILKENLESVSDMLILPEESPGVTASWFGFVISTRENCPVSKQELVEHLEENMIGTRQLFAGNMVRQPYLQGVEKRIVGDLRNTDFVMNHTFWVGCWPGLNREHMLFITEKIKEKLK